MPDGAVGGEAVGTLLEAAAAGGGGLTGLTGMHPEKRFFGYFCSYWPEELVLALGLEPLRLFPPDPPGVPACLPSYACAVARGCAALGESGGFKELAGVGFSHTCDTMQALSGVWRSSIAPGGTFVLVPPVNLAGAGAAAYYAAELESAWRGLAVFAGRPADPEALRGSIRLCNSVRRLVQRLEGMRPRLPSGLAAALLRAGQLVPRAGYAALLTRALAELEGPGPAARRLPLLVSGSVLENEALHEMIETLGGRVVADDTCSGNRHFAGLVDEDGDPFAALARRYLGRPACPCRARGPGARLDHLLDLAGARGAVASVLVVRKYCDPHSWDSVDLRAGLREAGIPAMILELDSVSVGERERTRLQAFLEGLT